MRFHLVSFADGLFAPRKEGFVEQAKYMNMYQSVTVYDLATLPREFASDHGEFVRRSGRGFGYWLWKPAIVLDRLLTIGADEILVYADIGFTQNPGGRNRMIEYGLIAQSSPFGLLSFMHPYTEYHWCKRDLAARLGVDGQPRVMATSQLGGGLFVLTKTDHTVGVMREWLALGVEDGYRFIDDSPSRLPEHPGFVEHRHDQSIGSLVRKLRGTEITSYEVERYHHAFESQQHSFPMWATRLRR